GFRTCVLTNSWVDDTPGRSRAAALVRRLRPHLELLLESCRIGMRKPDPRIYSHALRELRARPEEV
ncbi:HYES hydrolase, partial [Thryothorus ludovicianus]|nr:HYES hydrolase [Thryothorus ludovicianus]